MKLFVTINACLVLASAPNIVGAAQPESGAVGTQKTITSTATVENVNRDTREVTLKRSDGSKVTMKVPESVRNLDQVKAGDKVRAKYTETVAVDIRKSDEPPSALQSETLKRAPLGALPAGEQTTTTQISAAIEKINHHKREVTLRLPDGSTTVVEVPKDVKRFDTLKKGDQVVVTVQESLALNVTPK